MNKININSVNLNCILCFPTQRALNNRYGPIQHTDALSHHLTFQIEIFDFSTLGRPAMFHRYQALKNELFDRQVQSISLQRESMLPRVPAAHFARRSCVYWTFFCLSEQPKEPATENDYREKKFVNQRQYSQKLECVRKCKQTNSQQRIHFLPISFTRLINRREARVLDGGDSDECVCSNYEQKRSSVNQQERSFAKANRL